MAVAISGSRRRSVRRRNDLGVAPELSGWSPELIVRVRIHSLYACLHRSLEDADEPDHRGRGVDIL